MKNLSQMNKQFFRLEYFNYQLSKLTRIIQVIITKLITFLYKKKVSSELLLLMKKNRDSLRGIKEYLPEGEYDSRDNNYGIQNYIFYNLTKEIDLFPTYTDILTLLFREFKEDNLIYLEIGTSVFKNFQQIESNLENAILYGYDMNDLIPSIKEKYNLIQKENKNTRQNYYYSKGLNEIYYFKNNVLSKEGSDIFKKLLAGKVNVIFSDALHSKKGVLSEYENIIKGNLSDNFCYCFDDLNMYDVEEGVKKIYKNLKSENEKIKYFSFWTYGWIGQYEKLHKIGLITTFDISSIFKKKGINLPLFKEIS
ncbi:MAG: hypothetical protein CMC31_03395 [Flavobacteriaceae bacterium]|nr:hypothetical protein [Flavobacteriaceae bacterium]|tara:strand:- start:2378 stop:3304 length:927 start_codon:yes stop_codon:yes gene_type:complete